MWVAQHDKVMSKINNLDKPNNVKVNIGGASDDINNAMTQLALQC